MRPRLMYQPALTSQATTAAMATATKLIPAKATLFSPLSFHAAHLADELPFRIGHRLHRQARVFGERHVFELRFGLDRSKRHRLQQWLERRGLHRHPRLAFGGGRIGEELLDDLADADHLLRGAGVIEEELLALLHRLEVSACREIAHAAPGLALLAAFDLIVPGELLRLGLQQPI